MSESFGARLRRRREEQGVALAAIAEETKIKLSLLEGLERDDVSRWPSGIFRRAFIRAYAQAIGLDPDAAVREFLEVHLDPSEVLETPGAPGNDGAPANGGPPTRFRSMVGSALGSLSRRRRGAVPDDPRVEAAAAEVPPAAPAPPSLEPLPEPSFEAPTAVAVEPGPATAPSAAAPDFLAVADLCTEFGRVDNSDQLHPLLQEAARILDAAGLIVWLWDAAAGQLRHALVHGYSDQVLAQLPPVDRDADNATAAAFRSGQTCAVSGTADTTGALVLPLLTPAGCAGVLALELQRRGEQEPSIRAAATIFAALLAQLVGGAGPADARPDTDITHPPGVNVVRFAGAGR